MLSVMSKRSYGLYQNFKSKNSEPTGIAISAHKRRGPALFVCQNIHTPHKATESARREIAHIMTLLVIDLGMPCSHRLTVRR